MNNFEYSNPTRLVFGKGEESRIGEPGATHEFIC